MSQLTIVPHGDQAAVILPDDLLKTLGAGIGGVLEATPGDRQLTLRSVDPADHEKHLPGFLKDLFERRGDAYRRLA